MPDPHYAHCPACAGGRPNCPRCDGEGIVEETPVAANPHETCATTGCEWTSGGTITGCPPPLCSAYGGPRGCMADWLSCDPEDREPYADYLAEEARRHG